LKGATRISRRDEAQLFQLLQHEIDHLTGFLALYRFTDI